MKYVCPQCQTLLIARDDKFFCSKCSKEWRIVNGVLKLSGSPSYWGLLPAEVMRVFLKQVRARGWRDAILSSAYPEIKGLYAFTDCPSRADGAFYLSLTPRARVLDLGSGWGSYTFALSPRVKEVVAADTSLESLEFISLRARQDNRNNITAVQIEPLDYGKIPFADNSFDAVIMNGVLEWVGSYLKKGDPLKIQEKCLKEVRRVLKPGGEAWIGIENRFGLRYLLGAQDDHLKYYSSKKIAYTTLFPRLMAGLITKISLGIPYRTYTHSLWGYRRLLKRAGFKTTEFYFPEQDYRAASSRIYPVQSGQVRKSLKNRMRKPAWLKLLSLLRLEPALCDSYFILLRSGKSELRRTRPGRGIK
jgi:SAM-dependent methyltransferase